MWGGKHFHFCVITGKNDWDITRQNFQKFLLPTGLATKKLNFKSFWTKKNCVEVKSEREKTKTNNKADKDTRGDHKFSSAFSVSVKRKREAKNNLLIIFSSSIFLLRFCKKKAKREEKFFCNSRKKFRNFKFDCCDWKQMSWLKAEASHKSREFNGQTFYREEKREKSIEMWKIIKRFSGFSGLIRKVYVPTKSESLARLAPKPRWWSEIFQGKSFPMKKEKRK